MKVPNKLTLGAVILTANIAGCQPGTAGKQAESADIRYTPEAQCTDHTPENSGINVLDINEVRRVLTTILEAEAFADRYCPNYFKVIQENGEYYVITQIGKKVNLAKAITLQIKGELPHPIDMKH